MASYGADQYPPFILERVAAAHHNSSIADVQIRYKFAVLYDDQRPMRDPGSGGIFDDLDAANNAALDLFMTEATDWFDQVDGWTNFFESGVQERAESQSAEAEEYTDNVVEWSVNSRGLLTLRAWSEEGEEITISVSDFQVDED